MLKRRDRGAEGGAAAVEFALVLIPMLAVIFGLVQYGLYFYSAQTGSNTANSALRQLAVGNCQTDATLATYVNNQLGAADVGTPTITRDYENVDGSTPASPAPEKVDIGGTVKLTLSFKTLNMNFPFVPFLNDPQVTRVVEARVEDNTDQGCGS